MQEWLKDKKNLPVVGGLGVLVLVLAVVAILFEMKILPPQPAAPEITSVAAPPQPLPGVSAPPAPAPGGPPPQAGAPPAPGAPAAVPGAKAAAKPSAPPNVAKGPDPFRVALAQPKLDPSLQQALRVRNALPPVFMQQYSSADRFVPSRQGQTPPPIDLAPQVSANMRMSGVVFTDNAIKAILETNGVSQQVQPGDLVDGGRVISIQADGLTMRTADSRLVRVPLSGASTGDTAPPVSQQTGGGDKQPPPDNAPQPGDNPPVPDPSLPPMQ